MTVSRETNKAKLLISRGLGELGVSLSQERVEKLASYASLILAYSSKAGLTSYRSLARIVNNLVLDSLVFYGLGIKLEEKKVLDVGAGAGIPSLPLKIANNQWSLDLLEPSAKKAAFLKKVLHEQGLSRTRVLLQKIESLTAEPADRYFLVFSRGFGHYDLLLQVVHPLLETGGLVVLYHGYNRAEELLGLAESQSLTGYCLLRQEKFSYSFLTHPRYLTVFKKI